MAEERFLCILLQTHAHSNALQEKLCKMLTGCIFLNPFLILPRLCKCKVADGRLTTNHAVRSAKLRGCQLIQILAPKRLRWSQNQKIYTNTVWYTHLQQKLPPKSRPSLFIIAGDWRCSNLRSNVGWHNRQTRKIQKEKHTAVERVYYKQSCTQWNWHFFPLVSQFHLGIRTRTCQE